MDERIADDADAREETAPAPYKISVVRLADGTFTVYEESLDGTFTMYEESRDVMEQAVPYQSSDDVGAEMRKSFPSLEEALKEVIRIDRQNPVSGDEQVQFQAGADAEGYEEASR